MKIPKHKKKYYIPGTISLALLTVAFYTFVTSATKPSGIKRIPVFIPDTAFFRKQGIDFPKRNYTDIVFTGNLQNDKIKLAFAQVRIREILDTKDTINGVHFLFSDNANFGTFIVVINMLYNENARTWLPVDNHLWFFERPRNP